MGSKKSEIFCAPSQVTVHPALKQYFAYCLYKAAQRLRSKLDEGLRIHGVIAPQYGVLSLLKTAGPMSQVELGREMSIDKATIVKLVDRLETKNYLERNFREGDRRVNELAITDKGRKFLEVASKVRRSVEEDFLSPLSAQERKLLEKMMPKLLK